MFSTLRHTRALAVACLATCGAAEAATITVSDVPGNGVPVALDGNQFSASGPCGSGSSVINDGCSVALKSDPDAEDAYGRFDPWGGSWIDSQDLSEVTWTFATADRTFNRLVFALTDAYDQPFRDKWGESFFRLSVDGAEWTIDEQQANGNIHWVTIWFGEERSEAEIHFSTRQNDGWGIRAALVAPVPLPAAGLLMLAGLGALAAVGGARRAKRPM